MSNTDILAKDTALYLDAISQSFEQADNELQVLKDIQLKIKPGEVVGVVGPSGSGKSSLLHIAGLLEKPKSGRVFIDGEAALDFSDDKKTKLRRSKIGFVYQYHHLLPEFSALENVMMPEIIAGHDKQEASKRAARLLEEAGLGERLEHRPTQLSGGEQQRVAIARALANKPALILADEPTGNLDPETGNKLFQMMCKIVRQEKSGALIVTHNMQLAEQCDRQYRLHQGHILG